MHTQNTSSAEIARPEPINLTTPQAADYLGLAISTLNKWRCHGDGPKFIKLGRSVRYQRVDLDAFIAARRKSSTSE